MATAKATAPIQLFGDKRLQRALLELEDKSASRVMRPTISKALDPVKKQAKANVAPHNRSGALFRSIAKQSGRTKKNNRAWGRVYVRNKPQIWNGKKINPAKYAHLVEFGHGGPFPAPPHPFLRSAMSQRRGQVNAVLIQEGWANMKKFSGTLRRKHSTMAAMKQAKQIGRFV